MGEIGKILLVIGAGLVVIGGLLLFLGKIPGVGRLPGDIYIKKDNFTFYFPLATCILISVIVSFILGLWNRR